MEAADSVIAACIVSEDKRLESEIREPMRITCLTLTFCVLAASGCATSSSLVQDDRGGNERLLAKEPAAAGKETVSTKSRQSTSKKKDVQHLARFREQLVKARNDETSGRLEDARRVYKQLIA